MTLQKRPRIGDPVAVPGTSDGDAGDLSRVVPPSRGREDLLPGSPAAQAWSNVIPFVRPAREPVARQAPDVALIVAERPAPLAAGERRARIAAFLIVSICAHAGIYAAFNRPPPPLASLGEVVVSAELVVGTNTPAGTAPTPGQSAEQSAPSNDNSQTEQAKTPTTPDPTPEPPLPEPQAAPPIPQAEAPPPAQQAEAPVAPQAPPTEQPPAIPLQETPPAAQPDAAAIPPQAQTEPPKVLPQEPPRPPAKEAPKQPAKETPAARDAKKEAAKQKRDAEREAERDTAKKAAKANRQKGPKDQRAPNSKAADQAGGTGRGRSDNDANYRGIVAAHLARFQRNNQSGEGVASVSFGISGSGGVTGVSLSRSSGNAALDQEAQAMVRRASPFPAPPGGRAMHFSVPIRFRLR